MVCDHCESNQSPVARKSGRKTRGLTAFELDEKREVDADERDQKY